MSTARRPLQPGWWYPLIGALAILACCAITLSPIALWFLDQSPDRRMEIVKTIVGGAALVAGILYIVEVTRHVDQRYHQGFHR